MNKVVKYNLEVKGKNVEVLSDGAYFTVKGLKCPIRFNNDQYDHFWWDEEIDDNYAAYYEIKPMLISTLKEEKRKFVLELKALHPEIEFIDEVNAATIVLNLRPSVDFYLVIPAIKASAVRIATFNTPLMIEIADSELPFDFSINGEVYNIILDNDLYKIYAYPNSYKTIFNNEITEDYSKSLFEGDIPRFVLLRTKMAQTDERRQEVFGKL